MQISKAQAQPPVNYDHKRAKKKNINSPLMQKEQIPHPDEDLTSEMNDNQTSINMTKIYPVTGGDQSN